MSQQRRTPTPGTTRAVICRISRWQFYHFPLSFPLSLSLSLFLFYYFVWRGNKRAKSRVLKSELGREPRVAVKWIIGPIAGPCKKVAATVKAIQVCVCVCVCVWVCNAAFNNPSLVETPTKDPPTRILWMEPESSWRRFWSGWLWCHLAGFSYQCLLPRILMRSRLFDLLRSMSNKCPVIPLI